MAPLLGGFLVVMAALVVVSLTVFNQSPAVAVTPALLETTPISSAASMVMKEISQVSKSATGTRNGVTENVIRSTSWALSTFINDAGTIESSAVEPQWRDVTFKIDGSTRVVTTAGEPFEGENTEGLSQPGTVLEETNYPAGSDEFGQTYTDPPPTDSAEVGDYLARTSGLGAPTLGDYFVEIRSLLSNRILTGSQESALLAFLSQQQQLRIDGSTTDRLGRTGIIFRAADRRPGVYEDLLIVSATAGVILASETIYVGNDRDDIPSPAVVEYTAWER